MNKSTYAALALALLLTGCSSASEQSSTDKTLTYWSMWKQGEPQQQVIQSALEAFTKETGVKVNVQWVGRDVVKQKLPAALNTSNIPDLVDQAQDQIGPLLAKQGVLEGLGKVYEADIPGEAGKKVKDVIPAKYLDSLGMKLPDGQPYMVPYSMSGVGLFYDAAALPQVKAGTWEEFVAVLDQVKATTAPITLDADQGWSNSYWMSHLLYRAFGPGGIKKLGEDRSGAAWKDPKVLDAAQKLEKLAKGGYFLKGYDASKAPEQQKNWAQGKAAFFLMGSWAPVESKSYAKSGITFASIPFPSLGGPIQSEEAAVFGFAVPKKAKHVAQAQQFAAFFMNKELNAKFATSAETMSIRTDVPAPESLKGLKAQLDAVPAIEQFSGGADFPGWGDKVYFPAVTDLLLGKLGAQEFVDTVVKAQAGYWKANG